MKTISFSYLWQRRWWWWRWWRCKNAPVSSNGIWADCVFGDHEKCSHQRDLLRQEDQYAGVSQVQIYNFVSIKFCPTSIILHFILQEYTCYRKINILRLRGGCSSGSSVSWEGRRVTEVILTRKIKFTTKPSDAHFEHKNIEMDIVYCILLLKTNRSWSE